MRNVVFFTSFGRVDARALRTEAVVAVDALVVVVVRVALLLATHDGNVAALQTEYRHFTRVQAFGVLKERGVAEAAQFVVELIGEIALDLLLTYGLDCTQELGRKGLLRSLSGRLSGPQSMPASKHCRKSARSPVSLPIRTTSLSLRSTPRSSWAFRLP